MTLVAPERSEQGPVDGLQRLRRDAELQYERYHQLRGSQPGLARSALALSLEMRRRLYAKDPSSRDLTMELVLSLSAMARLMADDGSLGEAAQLWSEQVPLLQDLVAADECDLRAQEFLFCALELWSRAAAERGEQDVAADLLDDAIEVLGRLVVLTPAKSEWLNFQVEAKLRRAALPGAEPRGAQLAAVEAAKRWAQLEPCCGAARAALLRAHRALGQTLAKRGEWAAAAEYLATAVALGRELAANSNLGQEPRLLLAETLEAHGEAEAKIGSTELATSHLREAAEMLRTTDFGCFEAARAAQLARIHQSLCALALDRDDARVAEREAEQGLAWARCRVAHEPASAQAHLQLAAAYQWYTLALRLANRAMAARPAWRDGLEALRKVVALEPQRVEGWRLLANELEQGASTRILGDSAAVARTLLAEAVAARRRACIVAPAAEGERMLLVRSIGGLMAAEQRCGHRRARDLLSLEQQVNLRYLVVRGMVTGCGRSADELQALKGLQGPAGAGKWPLGTAEEPAATWRFGALASEGTEPEAEDEPSLQEAEARWAQSDAERHEEERELKEEEQALRAAKFDLESRRRVELQRRAEEDRLEAPNPNGCRALRDARAAEDERFSALAKEQAADEGRHRARRLAAELRWMSRLSSQVGVLRAKAAREDHVRCGRSLPVRWIQ